MLLQRLIALLILAIPGAGSVYGVKIMRDSIFDYFNPAIGQFPWLKFFGGLLLFLAGMAFIAGYIFNREKKTGRLQKKLQRKAQMEEWMKRNNK